MQHDKYGSINRDGLSAAGGPKFCRTATTLAHEIRRQRQFADIVLPDRELTHGFIPLPLLLRRLQYSFFYCYMYKKRQLCVFFLFSSGFTNNVHYPYACFASTLYPFSWTSSQLQRPCITLTYTSRPSFFRFYFQPQFLRRWGMGVGSSKLKNM